MIANVIRSTARYAIPVAFALTACRSTTVSPPSPFPATDSLRTNSIAPGVTYTYAWENDGPWGVHLLRINRERCAPVLEAIKPGTELRARGLTSAMGAQAIAAVNADFFAIPAGNPVGAHVSRGLPLTGPSNDRGHFTITPGGWSIGTTRVAGIAAVRSDSVAVVQINRATTQRGNDHGLTLFTAWIGDTIPRDSAALRITLRLINGNESSGRAVVTAVDSPAVRTPRAPDAFVLHAHGHARAWARRRAAGDTVSWHSAVVTAQGTSILESVGGYVTLLRNGESVVSETQTAASFAGRNPRTAVGWTKGQRELLLVVVDGRQKPYSDGMTLDELAALFQRLGATDALNLDGGGSTTMVVQGRVVNRYSDAAGERPVGNALALVRCNGR